MTKRGVFRHIRFVTLVLLLVGCLPLTAPAQSIQTAPDATGMGPFAVTSAEYKFDPTLDLDVSGMATELWARVYRPVNLTDPPYPLLVFLHGNHGTCGVLLPSPPFPPNIRNDNRTQYTFYGTCPTELGYVVTPNHMGYTYIAERLASWGYIVVSINANRGVTAAPGTSDDLGVNLVRGRLILRHLQRLSEWNTNGGTPPSLGVELQGMLDFNNVGLFGHSRGGEGVRAAYNQYRDASSPWPARIPDPVHFAGVFEIGPVDGQTSRILTADGTAWNVLLPVCDGDVSDLQGIKPLNRMMKVTNENPATQKSSFTVWGTNHNFNNTEWQISDSDGCFGPGNAALFGQFIPGSEKQRQVSLQAVMAFFRGNVGANADPTFNENFNPQFALPPNVTSVTRVDRGYTDSPSSDITLVFEDFDKPTGTNTYGTANDASNITISHGSIPQDSNNDAYGRPGVQRAAAISWTSSGGFFQTNWTNTGTGRDINAYQTLDVRLSRQCVLPGCQNPSPLNPAGPTNFSVQMVMADGSISDPVQIQNYTSLVGPVGGGFAGNPLHPVLQTARISLMDFNNADFSQIRGVRFTFNGTPTGAIYFGNIRVSLFSGLVDPPSPTNGSAGEDTQTDNSRQINRVIYTEGNTLSIRNVFSAAALNNQPAVEILVTSNKDFPVQDELAVLRIGNQSFALSRYSDTGETNTLIFTLTPDEFAQVSSGDPVFVQYGFSDNARVLWNFGTLDKGAVNR
jgi:hypothetical protein